MVLIFIHLVSNAQNSISLSPTQSVALDFAAPFEPGSPIEAVMDDSKWLNYSVTVTPPESPVSISAEITSGTVSEGLQIQLQAGAYNGTGGGDPGTTSGNLILTNIPQVLISNIGTCSTGDGVNVGHQLTYTLSISDYNSVKSSSSTVNVLFTITQ
jgi:hypothetical protein